MPNAVTLARPWGRAKPARARSFWLTEALAADEPSLPPLTGAERADVCVVGAGFTGLWTALELTARAPGISVRLLEADVCGGGASGANAGYLMNLWPKLSGLRSLAPPEEALAIAAASSEALEEVFEFAVRAGIECTRTPWLWAATNSAQVGSWEETLAVLEAAGQSVLVPISAAEVEARTGAQAQFGGVLDESCAVLQPAALCRALARAAGAAGVAIHEGSPVTAIESAAGKTVVRTPAGRVEADHVVLAINAWAAQLPGLGRKMMMVASDTAVTDPVPGLLASSGWREPLSISDSRRRLNYFRTTADGRLVFGKGGVGVGYGSRGADSLWGAPRLPEMERQLARTFPGLAAAPVASSWRAPVEYSLSSLPFCAQLPRQHSTWVLAGYSGDGVGPSKLMARIVAARVLGADDPLAHCALAQVPAGDLPPEPLRWLGSRIVLPALAAAERREDDGCTVPGPLRRVAGLDPTDFVG